MGKRFKVKNNNNRNTELPEIKKKVSIQEYSNLKSIVSQKRLESCPLDQIRFWFEQ